MKTSNNKWDALCILGCLTLTIAGTMAAIWLSEKSELEVNFDPCDGPSKAETEWAKYVAKESYMKWSLEDLEEAEEILMEASRKSGNPREYDTALWFIQKKIQKANRNS